MAPRQKGKELRHFGRAVPLALAFVLTMGAVALADNAIADGDNATPVNTNPLAMGDVCRSASSSDDALLAISRNGDYGSTNVFKKGSSVTWSVPSATPGLTAIFPDGATGSIPSNWDAVAKGSGRSPEIRAQVSYAAPDSTGSFTGTITFRATGVRDDNEPLTRDATMTVTANRITCAAPNTAPTLSLPSDMTVEGNTLGGAVVSYTATANDTEEGPLTPTCSPVSGSFFALGGPHTVNCSVTDSGSLTTNGSFTVTVVDTTVPAFTNVPADISKTATGNSQATATWTDPTATNIVDGARPVTCSPASGSTFNIGVTTVTCSASDLSSNSNSASFTVTVIYDWNGFFRPVDNLPTLNVAKAGSAIPIKFSLSGNQGLGIMAAGSPTSKVSTCETAGAADTIEETVTAGQSSLSYDASADQYTYVWKTDKSWAGTCRTLTVKLADGSIHQALFKLQK